MQKWTDNIKTIQDEDIKLGIVAADNQYACFGRGTMNIFRNMLALPEAKLEEGRKTTCIPFNQLRQLRMTQRSLSFWS